MYSWRRRCIRHRISYETGLALPIAIFMVVAISLLSITFSSTTRETLETGALTTRSVSNFLRVEGAIDHAVTQLLVYPDYWNSLPPLNGTTSGKPLGYTSYDPDLSPNGIPICVGIDCERNYFPISGGLLKNFGPITGGGGSLDTNFPVTAQLNYSNPGDPDVRIAEGDVWYQIERLDQISFTEGALGGSLASDKSGSYTVVRYRLTAKALTSYRGVAGESTIVAVVEVPVT